MNVNNCTMSTDDSVTNIRVTYMINLDKRVKRPGSNRNDDTLNKLLT